MIKSLGSLVAVVLMISLAILIYAYTSTRNVNQGTIVLNGLHGSVQIVRDTYGIAHIESKVSDTDVFFALAYVHSQDRFWQMEFQRHIAQGRLSELFGSTTIDSDAFLRTVGFYRAAQLAWPAFDPKSKEIIQAYTAGVNAFLQTGHLPLQFKILRYQPKPWTVIDTIAWQKMMAFDLKNDYNQQWSNLLLLNKVGLQQFRKIRQGLPANTPTTLSVKNLKDHGLFSNDSQLAADAVPHTSNQAAATNHPLHKLFGINTDSTGLGSNAWVVDGSKSATGKPLLANDPHLGLGLPGVWYLAELRGPTLHVMGATIPGLPVVAIGHNDHIAWGITSSEVEVIDLFMQPDPTKLTTRPEIINVKGQQPVKIMAQDSSQGPIINSWLVPKPAASTVPFAMMWTGLSKGDTSLQSFIKLNYANNWPEFHRAMRDLWSPSLNVFYADTAGNVGYQLVGHIPRRDNVKFSHLDYLPLNARPPYLWQGFIPFEQLPYALNPAEHHIASANNKIVPDSYFYPLTRYWEDPGYRITRINSLLNHSKSLTQTDMQQFQLDTFSELWSAVKSPLLQTKPLDKPSKLGLSLLNKWNGHAETDSLGATVFTYWYKVITEKINARLDISYSVNEALFISEQITTQGEYCRFGKESCHNFLSITLQEAMKNLEHDLGQHSNDWQWGRVHQSSFKEAGLGEVPYLGGIWNHDIATPGAESTVNVGGMKLPSLHQVYGATYRQVIDLSHLDNSSYVISTGQSDDPFSKHHNDFMKLWQKGSYIRMNVVSANDQHLVLMPGKTLPRATQ